MPSNLRRSSVATRISVWIAMFASALLAGANTLHAAGATGRHLIVFTAALDLDLNGLELGGLYIMRSDGTGLRKLSNFQTINFNWELHGFNLPDDHADISPDGKQIVF